MDGKQSLLLYSQIIHPALRFLGFRTATTVKLLSSPQPMQLLTQTWNVPRINPTVKVQWIITMVSPPSRVTPLPKRLNGLIINSGYYLLTNWDDPSRKRSHIHVSTSSQVSTLPPTWKKAILAQTHVYNCTGLKGYPTISQYDSGWFTQKPCQHVQLSPHPSIPLAPPVPSEWLLPQSRSRWKCDHP